MKKLTPAMRAALQSAVDTGRLTTHLRGQSAWGGFEGTARALRRRGYVKGSEITAEGRAVLDAANERSRAGSGSQRA